LLSQAILTGSPVTRPCEVAGFCYHATTRVERYLNSEFVWKALGVRPGAKKYSAGNNEILYAFLTTNDEGISMRPQIEYILLTGIDVLIYQGKLDLACNTAGNLRWTTNMPWKGQAAFDAKSLEPWELVLPGQKATKAGEFKEVQIQMLEGQKKTRFAFLTIDGAGHMVPQDKPEASYQFYSRWLNGMPFA